MSRSLGGEHQLQPDLVGGELAEGEVAQPGVLTAADAVLDVGVGAVPGLELGQVVAAWSVMKTSKRTPWWSVKVS